MHPRQPRCSSLKYSRYSRSSRLASGAPRPSRCDARLSPRAANLVGPWSRECRGGRPTAGRVDRRRTVGRRLSTDVACQPKLLANEIGRPTFAPTVLNALRWATFARVVSEGRDQNTNFRPSCSSRIGFLVLLIVPYNGLVNVVFGSSQIGLFTALNASSRNCSVLLRIRKFRMIDASTLRMPGPKNVLRPALPQVPNGSSVNASVLNHRAIDCWSPGKIGLIPVVFGRSVPAPVFDLSVPVYAVLGNPLDFEMIVLICHPPRIALPTPVFAYGFPSPNGNSYRIDETNRWRTSKIDNPHSQLRKKLFCGNSVSPLSTRMPLPLSVDLDNVYAPSTDNPVCSHRVSLI